MNHEENMQARANHAKKRVMELYEEATASEDGRYQVIMAIGGITIHVEMRDRRAALLLGIAEKVVPSEYEYMVLETYGGPPQLVITGVNQFNPL